MGEIGPDVASSAPISPQAPSLDKRTSATCSAGHRVPQRSVRRGARRGVEEKPRARPQPHRHHPSSRPSGGRPLLLAKDSPPRAPAPSAIMSIC
jgi:hypothetical protein